MISELQRETAAVRVLLVSRNISTIEFLCQHTQQVGMHIEIACGVESATRKLCHSKFEGVIVDFELPEGLELLKKMRALTSHEHAIALAIATQKADKAATLTHANFVLQHPLSSASVSSILRASYPIMFRERQRYYRCPIEVRTFIKTEMGPEFSGSSINISETGIAVNSPTPLKVGAPVCLRMDLPRLTESLEFCGEVHWSDGIGRMGIRFLDLPVKLADRLRIWISERMGQMIPGSPLSPIGRN